MVFRRPVRYGAAIFLLLGVLSGCTTSLRQWADQGFKVGPDYHMPGARVATGWIDADAPEVNDSVNPENAWWTVFNDPVLDGLIATASAQNLSIQEAGARILEAEYRLTIARGSLFPQTQEAFGSYTRTQRSGTSARPIRVRYFDSWMTGLNASWELDFWGRFRRGIEASSAEFQASVEDYRDALVLLQAEVATAYIQTRVAQERIALAKQNIELQQDTLELAEFRFQEGQTTKLDVTQAKQILASTQALVPQQEIALRESQNALCVLLGVPPRDLNAELGAGPIPEPATAAAVGIPAQLLRRRPDIRRAERLVAAQSARIGIAESDLYPRIAITGTIGYETRDLPNLFRGNSLEGAIGPGFQWNILNYGRILGNVAAEEARFEQLVLRYQDSVLKAHEEVENGLHRFLREGERARFLETGVEAASESNELARSQYEIGAVDFQRLLDSERALVLLQDQRTAARGQVAANLVAVYRALGGGWQPTYPSVPEWELVEPLEYELPLESTPTQPAP